ncbi:hypothetical protein [Solibacillus sp. FSL K6-1523]|uniref:hypothetical protein n=1 Tax=Solibacillus sp. FSL K6-1523 TaxID=2921471 RepID=UPI0030F69182
MDESKKIINRDKDGRIIEDLSEVTLPQDLEISIFKILNPDLSITEVRFSS